MNGSARFTWIALLLPIVSLTTMLADGARGQTEEAGAGAASTTPATAKQAAERKREQRREFQSQELMLAKSGTWIFKPGETPRILWRDVETVRRLGCSQPLRVRWFDVELNESPEPNAPGRWIAWAEDAGEPFVTLVARRGVIVTHEAFGRDASGQPIDRDYRCWVASITKTVTAILFSQLLHPSSIIASQEQSMHPLTLW